MIAVEDFASVITGGTPSTFKPEYWDKGQVPWLNSGELNKRVIYHADNFITEEGLQNSAAKMMPENSVLIALTGATTGVSALLKIRACANQSVTGILPSKSHNPNFLFHYLQSVRPKIVADSYGGAQKHISQEYVKKLKIPLPPLAVQEHIAKLLDEADALRKLRTQADTRTAELIPALFDEMFGNPETNPKNWLKANFDSVISSTKLGLVRGSNETGDSLPYPYVRMDAIRGGGSLMLEPIKKVNANESELEDFSLRDGDFLFNTRNSRELVGKTALFKGSGTYLFNNNIMRTRFTKAVDPEYMIALFQTDFVRRQLEARKSGTTSVVAIYFKNLRDVQVTVPPLPLQKEFAARVTAIRELGNQQSASRSRLEALFQSMLHKAFRGEL